MVLFKTKNASYSSASGFSSSNKMNVTNKITILNNKAVPEILQCHRTRTMIIANVFRSNGFYLFPSKNSFDIFKKEKTPKLNEEGVGIPLLHFERLDRLLGTKFEIFKYEIRSSNEPPPYGDYKIVDQDERYKIYKYSYCKIEKTKPLSMTNGSYPCTFDFLDNTSITLAPVNSTRDADSTYMGYSFRWHIDFFDIFEYSLIYLPATEKWMQSNIRERKNKSFFGISKVDYSSDIILATISSRKCDILPRRVNKMAKIVVGENSNNTDYFGIKNVPDMTLKFAVQALYLFELQSERNAAV